MEPGENVTSRAFYSTPMWDGTGHNIFLYFRSICCRALMGEKCVFPCVRSSLWAALRADVQLMGSFDTPTQYGGMFLLLSAR